MATIAADARSFWASALTVPKVRELAEPGTATPPEAPPVTVPSRPAPEREPREPTKPQAPPPPDAQPRPRPRVLPQRCPMPSCGGTQEPT